MCNLPILTLQCVILQIFPTMSSFDKFYTNMWVNCLINPVFWNLEFEFWYLVYLTKKCRCVNCNVDWCAIVLWKLSWKSWSGQLTTRSSDTCIAQPNVQNRNAVKTWPRYAFGYLPVDPPVDRQKASRCFAGFLQAEHQAGWTTHN